MVTAIAIALALIALLSPMDPPIPSTDSDRTPTVPAKTQRPEGRLHPSRDDTPASRMGIRVWLVPADFTNYLTLKRPPGEDYDPFGPTTGPQER
jgi:hypothetical protein